MKKCTFTDILDDVFWYIVYLLPIIMYVFNICGHGDGSVSILEYFNTNFSTLSNVIFDTLTSVFGQTGVLPLFGDQSFIVGFLTYFICCMIIHLAVDFLLFIPRLCHKWMFNFVSRGGSLG